MPRLVRAWACQFRCGYKVQTSKVRMKEHEDWCYMNPVNRACKSCGRYLLQESDGSEPGGSYCDEDNLGGKLRQDCEKWIPESETEAENA